MPRTAASAEHGIHSKGRDQTGCLLISVSNRRRPDGRGLPSLLLRWNWGRIEAGGAVWQPPSGFLNAVTSSAMVQFAVPILCVLPATTAFLDDISSGFVKSYLPRIGKYAYIKGKVIACAVSGGGTLVVGALISWLATTLLLFPTEVVLKANEVPPYYVHKLLTVFSLLFLNGAFWGPLGYGSGFRNSQPVYGLCRSVRNLLSACDPP